MHRALVAAGSEIPAAPSFLERFVDDALATSIGREWAGARCTTRRQVPLLEWERLKTSTSSRPTDCRESDLQVIAPGASTPCLLTEQKVWDFDASLFDVAKQLSFARLPGVTSTYLVGAGRAAHFAGPGAGRALYAFGERRWSVTELIGGAWRTAWEHHITRAGVAPRRLPMFFTTRLIATAPVAAFPDHEMRCVRIVVETRGLEACLRQGRQLFEHPPENV